MVFVPEEVTQLVLKHLAKQGRRDRFEKHKERLETIFYRPKSGTRIVQFPGGYFLLDNRFLQDYDDTYEIEFLFLKKQFINPDTRKSGALILSSYEFTTFNTVRGWRTVINNSTRFIRSKKPPPPLTSGQIYTWEHFRRPDSYLM
jgi:hypothetical protein